MNSYLGKQIKYDGNNPKKQIIRVIVFTNTNFVKLVHESPTFIYKGRKLHT